MQTTILFGRYIEAKVGLATLLSNFKFEKSQRTKVPLSYHKKMVVLMPEGGMHIKTTKL